MYSSSTFFFSRSEKVVLTTGVPEATRAGLGSAIKNSSASREAREKWGFIICQIETVVGYLKLHGVKITRR
jgi:hypothetical protein